MSPDHVFCMKSPVSSRSSLVAINEADTPHSRKEIVTALVTSPMQDPRILQGDGLRQYTSPYAESSKSIRLTRIYTSGRNADTLAKFFFQGGWSSLYQAARGRRRIHGATWYGYTQGITVYKGLHILRDTGTQPSGTFELSIPVSRQFFELATGWSS